MSRSRKGKAAGAVYRAPDPAMPDVAVVIADGRIVLAEVVSSSDQGKRLLAQYLDVLNAGRPEMAENSA